VSQTIDANVLVYASNEDDPATEAARAFVARLAAGPDLVVLFWPVLIGYLRIATHPSIFAAPLAPAIAERNVESLLDRPHIRVVSELQGYWTTYRHVTGQTPVRGNLVSDAALVALMRQHGVTTIWTRDRDLRKFDGITARSPFD